MWKTLWIYVEDFLGLCGRLCGFMWKTLWVYVEYFVGLCGRLCWFMWKTLWIYVEDFVGLCGRLCGFMWNNLWVYVKEFLSLYIYIYCCAHCNARVVTNNNKPYQSGAVTKAGKAQRMAAYQR